MYTKAQLKQMNNSSMGRNWILNIENIGENEVAQLHPTWGAWLGGRLYVALPSSLQITSSVKTKYDIM
jgi:hypothetical protein